jgi:hypothetical protein
MQTWAGGCFDPVENDSGISNMPFKQRFGSASVILVVGFLVGVGLRFYIDDAAERDLANYVRSGLHGSGIAFAGWLVLGFFAAKAHSPVGAALRRMPLLAEVLVRSLVMAVVIVIVGLVLQVVLYADSLQLRWLTAHWFKTSLPWIVAIGLTMSVVVGVVIETARLIGRPLFRLDNFGNYRSQDGQRHPCS